MTNKPQTDVASLELCKELYELSGWKGNDDLFYRVTDHYGRGRTNKKKWPNTVDLTKDKRPFGKYREDPGAYRQFCYPAYTLGYLLRKLPPYVHVWRRDEGAEAECYDPENPLFRITIHADTPADAVCKLAIELFKQGVLK